MTDEATRAPDAFVSHSTRDKALFVRPLVDCLAGHGATVWYDEYSMAPGDSLSTSIDSGLSEARYGLVVISPDFIRTARESGWTRYELRGIVSNSIGSNGRRIVPIWLDVSVDEVRDFSPPLADLLAIDATGKNTEDVALDVMEVIAPDRVRGLSGLRALMASAELVEDIPISDLRRSPPQDRRVGGHVVVRSLLVTQALADCGEPGLVELEGFLESLSADLRHEQELRLWEAIACSYVSASKAQPMSDLQKNKLLHLLLDASLGRTDEGAIETLGSEMVTATLDHFQKCVRLALGEALIGEGGLKGIFVPKDSTIDARDDSRSQTAPGEATPESTQR